LLEYSFESKEWLEVKIMVLLTDIKIAEVFDATTLEKTRSFNMNVSQRDCILSLSSQAQEQI
jgi:hypothetical protein